MSSLQCLRICRTCLARCARASLLPTRPENRCQAPVRRGYTTTNRRLLPSRNGESGKSGGPCPPEAANSKGSREEIDAGTDADAEADLDDLSEFGRLRLETLEKDRRSASPVCSEPYPRLADREDAISVPQFKSFYNHLGSGESAPRQVTVYGRVRSKRKHGSRLLFLDVVNQHERLQSMINFRICSEATDAANAANAVTMDQFKMFGRLVEVGDHVSITGTPTRSQSGELTVEASALPRLLSPALEQLPERLVENRFRRRHLDLLVNREAADTLRLRSQVIRYLREHFHAAGFVEVQTPILAERAGGAAARPFTTGSVELPSRSLAMRIAPELWLKRLVVGGLDRVFEIGPVFRNEGVDADHNPEFTMCEFYSAYTGLAGLMARTEELMRGLAEHCRRLAEADLPTVRPPEPGRFAGPFRQIEFVPALEAALEGFRLPDDDQLAGADALPALLDALARAGVEVPGGGGGGERPPATAARLLDRLAAAHLEPASAREPVFITHHPACMSPLAKSFACPRAGGRMVSARAELFIDGREIANMYEEENDPAEQLRKLRAGPRRGDAQGDADFEAEPLDRDYVRALRAGLPPTGGWGCGVERLVMLFSGASRIGDCLSFGTLRNVVSVSGEDRGRRAGHP